MSSSSSDVVARRVGAPRAPAVELRLVAVAEADDLDVVTLEVGGQHELGDLPETDDGEADGTVGDGERCRHR